MKHATGEYITHIDSDDFLLYEGVLTDLMPQIKDADILVFMYKYILEDGSSCPMALYNTRYDKVLNSNDELFHEIFQGGVAHTVAGKIFKKSLWDKICDYEITDHII